jgi:hypothetical protein
MYSKSVGDWIWIAPAYGETPPRKALFCPWKRIEGFGWYD